ncbi:hypothetical protein [Oricola sp.]|uniref:hypothetical protein n=1 Tax=Oricola sp. TaxID=1979950 RepID=UPI0035187A12
MTATLKIAEIVTASLIALSAVSFATPSYAEDAVKQEYALDTRTTGPVSLFGRTCIAADQDTQAGCKTVTGDETAHYPDAPVNFQFGF